MDGAINDLGVLLASMEPVLNEGVYLFAVLPDKHPMPLGEAVAAVREAEGWTVVVEESKAAHYGLEGSFRAAWMTLNVHSDLEAVGLTAAFAAALGKENISCNVIAGCFHDHIFVPHHQAQKAVRTLQALQRQYTDAV